MHSMTLRIEEYVFGCTVQLESKEANLGSSDLRDFPINRQNYRGSFSAMVIHGHASLQLFWGVDTSDSLGVICYDRLVLSEGHKTCFKD